MFLLCINRFRQINSSAQNQYARVNKCLWIRIGLIMVVQAMNLAFSFMCLYHEPFLGIKNQNSVYLFQSSVLCCQMGTILYEYKKSVPQMWLHKVYWVICLLLNIAETSLTIYLVWFDNNTWDTITVVFELAITFSYAILVIFSLFVRKQDIYEFENFPTFTLKIPQQDSKQSFIDPKESMIEQNSSVRKFQLKVKIDKQFSQQEVNGKTVIKMKITVNQKHPSKQYKLTKTIDDFLKLSQDLLQQDQNKMIAIRISDEFYDEYTTVVQKVELLKQYLANLVQSYDNFLPALCDFLNIDDQARRAINQEFVQRGRSASVDDLK
ncbi:hypothetical protein pb186bvf_007655 [Paramecium bursaria]